MDEKIEVGYRKISSVMGVDYHHKYLLYTNKDGVQRTISGWPDDSAPGLPYGKLKVMANSSYNQNNPDFVSPLRAKDRPQYRELIATGEDLSELWRQMSVNAKSKDGIYPYDPQRQNSNTLADAVLREAKLPEPKKDDVKHNWAPGSGLQLDEKVKPSVGGWRHSGQTISLNEEGMDPAREGQLRADPLYQQALVGLDRIGQGKGVYANETEKECIAAALAATARNQTPALPEIHEVLRSSNGENLFAVWKNPNNDQDVLRSHVVVDEAAKQPLMQNLQALEAANVQQERMQESQVELSRGAMRMG